MRALHAPTPGELAAENFRQAIFRGEYAPGRIVPVREIAERSRCRVPLLLAYLRRLEQDNLITIRHDVVMVRPLDSDELRTAFRTMALMHLASTDDRVQRLTDAELDAYEATYPTAPMGSATFRAQLMASTFRRGQILHGDPVRIIDRVTQEPIRNTFRRHFAQVPGRPYTDLGLLEALSEHHLRMGEVVRSRRGAIVRATLVKDWAASEDIGHQIVEISRDPEARREHARIIQLRR